MNIHLGRAISWPLRPLGLEPGHAAANAHPNEERRQAARAEQRAYIWAHYDAAATPPGAIYPTRARRSQR